MPSIARRVLSQLALLAMAAGAAAAQHPTATIDASRYPTLQAALDAVPDSGAVVVLPPGRFEIREPLVLSRGNVRIQGAGATTRIVNRNEAGQPALIVRSPRYTGAQGSRGAALWSVELADFRVSGNPRSGDGVQLFSVNEAYVDGVIVDHNGGHGLSLVDCYENPRIVSSSFTYNGQAGLHVLRGHDTVVNGNQFEENQDALRFLDGFNLTMTGNNLDDHLRHGVVIENTYGSVVSGNMIEESQGTAIVLDRDCYGITLSANVIAHDFGGGIDLRDAWGIAVSANTFTIVPQFAIRVGPGSGRVTISGNNFSNAYVGGRNVRDDAAAGIWLVGTEGVAITGNLFAGLTGEAVRQEGTNREILLQGNTVLPAAAR